MVVMACGDPSDEERSRARLHLDAGLTALRRQEVDEAIEELTAAIAIDPDLLEARYRLGLAHLTNKSDVPAAREALEAAIQVDPDHVPSLVKLGEIEFNLGEYESAREHLLHATSLDPGSFVGLMFLGKVFDRLQDWERAADAFLRAAEILPDRASARFWLGLIRTRQERWIEAAEALEAAIERERSHSSAYHQLSRVQRELGRAEAAERSTRIHALLQELTGDIRVRFERPELLQRRDAALELLELVPDAANVRLTLGDTYLQLAESAPTSGVKAQAIRKAEGAYLEAVTLNPDEVIARARLRLLYEQTGRPEEAEAMTAVLERLREESMARREEEDVR